MLSGKQNTKYKIQKFKTKYKKGKTLFGDTGSCSGPVMGTKVFSLKTDSL
jgi:hypothetical protein